MENQCNSKDLGNHIHQLLLAQNLENAMLQNNIDKWGNEEYVSQLEGSLAEFLKDFGFDLTCNSLFQTPSRVVKCFMNELFYGLNYRNFPELELMHNEFVYTSPIISKGIIVNSTCEHHLVAIKGQAVIAYIPKAKIIGLSKLNQVVDFFARRPQVQERLTKQVFVVLQDLLGTEDVAVAINAAHDCIITRGVKNADSMILSVETGGKFECDSALKTTFYQLTAS